MSYAQNYEEAKRDENTFFHPAETWSETQCEKAARRDPKNAFGDGYGKGYIGCSVQHIYSGGYGWLQGHAHYEDGRRYNHQFFPLPNIPDTFRIRYVLSRGYFIEKKREAKA